MKKLFLSFLLAITCYNLLAQKTISDGNAEKRTITSFHGIDVATGIRVILIEGSDEEVAVSASKVEYRARIVTEVVNGVLKIYYDTRIGAINKKNESKNLRAYVSYKTLDKLEVTTGAHVEISGVLRSSSIDLRANTGAVVKGEIDITTLTVDQETGSRITFSGKAGSLDVEGETGSKFLGEDLSTTDCSAAVSTGAGVHITVQNELSVKANTGGYVKYKGEAGIRSIKTNTGGYVSKI